MGLKAAWLSTSPWGPSSYSVLSARAVPEIVRLGHHVDMLTWYGLEGAPQRWPIRARGDKKGEPLDTVTIYPRIGDANAYGANVLLPFWQMLQPDVLITCMDLWVLPADVTRHVKLAAWLPIDHDPVPAPVLASLQPSVYTMSYSKWGVDVLRRAGVEAHYVPCSADANVFKPMDRAQARQDLGIPESCDMLVSMVSANKDPGDRKGFAEGLTGFAQFAQTHPNAYLYVHTAWGGPVNIPNLVTALGLAGRVIQPKQLEYLAGLYPDEYMRTVYSASDVLLNPAKSEGFGLPLLEAQMCGCPVAASDFSTTDELLFAGWKIGGRKHWSIGMDSWRLIVDPDKVTEALEAAYEARGNELLRKQARMGAVSLDTAKVADLYWRPALREIEEIVCGAKGGGLRMVQF